MSFLKEYKRILTKFSIWNRNTGQVENPVQGIKQKGNRTIRIFKQIGLFRKPREKSLGEQK